MTEITRETALDVEEAMDELVRLVIVRPGSTRVLVKDLLRRLDATAFEGGIQYARDNPQGVGILP